MTRPKAEVVDQIRRIAALLAEGYSQVDIANELGLSPRWVNKLKRQWIDKANPSRVRRALTKDCYDRWIDVHDIRSMGVRAVEETG